MGEVVTLSLDAGTATIVAVACLAMAGERGTSDKARRTLNDVAADIRRQLEN